MEGIAYLGSGRVVLRRSDGIQKVVGESHQGMDARKLAASILDFVGTPQLPENEVELLWDSANYVRRNNIVDSSESEFRAVYRNCGIWCFYMELPERAKQKVREYFNKEV
jgi:hypothetical protein